jgi:hypothetical protein
VKDRKVYAILGALIGLAAIIMVMIIIGFPKRSNKAEVKDPEPGATTVSVEKAVISLDLTSSWLQLNEEQRKTIKRSKGILTGHFFGVRKYDNTATLAHRLGTSSNFAPEWYDDGVHRVTALENPERKCHPDTKYSYMLNFDISNQTIGMPFDINYEIDFWNAHNGQKGDWHSFYVSRPIQELVIRVSFPPGKPYTKYVLKSAYGVECKAHDFKDYANPIVKEGKDEKTGARTLTWTIHSPSVQWIYEIGWEW